MFVVSCMQPAGPEFDMLAQEGREKNPNQKSAESGKPEMEECSVMPEAEEEGLART